MHAAHLRPSSEEDVVSITIILSVNITSDFLIYYLLLRVSVRYCRRVAVGAGSHFYTSRKLFLLMVHAGVKQSDYSGIKSLHNVTK